MNRCLLRLTQSGGRGVARLLGLIVLPFALPAAGGEAHFLRDGRLIAFDGRQQRTVEWLSRAAAQPVRWQHMFDAEPGNAPRRFLLSAGPDEHFRADSDAPAGHALWLAEAQGPVRLIHPSAWRARFAPDGQRVAYTTSAGQLRVEDLQGRRYREVPGAYNPAWRADGRQIVFEKVPSGRPVHLPETLHLAVLDVDSGGVALLTDGDFDDVRPEFHPSGKWILFVCGGRTGLASFWKIPAAGGRPQQLTNRGLDRVDDRFVPTPYRRTLWSADGRWFLYDFKNGETRQIWGLEFDGEGLLLRAVKLADGLDPQWIEDGKTFAYLRHTGEGDEPAEGRLP
ncbi:MAG: hypothetical protein N3I86_15645 [Verrucomicrobiae bacterium]|nr:hypothetical protein [Verrucomicrobiae bacterium]